MQIIAGLRRSWVDWIKKVKSILKLVGDDLQSKRYINNSAERLTLGEAQMKTMKFVEKKDFKKKKQFFYLICHV